MNEQHKHQALEPVQPAPKAPSTDKPAAQLRTLNSIDLFQGQAMVLIRHQGEEYRLQTTRQGKLILTK